jgi:hypothetical protein
VLVALGAFLVMLILGKHVPLYAALYKLVPLWRPFRYPVKLFPYLALLLALGAAVGLERLAPLLAARRRLAVGMGATAVACAALWLLDQQTGFWSEGLASLATRSPPSGHREYLTGMFTRATVQTALVVALFALALALRARRVPFTWVVPGLVFAQLYAANSERYELTFPDVFTTRPDFADVIGEIVGPPALGKPRVMSGMDAIAFPLTPGFTRRDMTAIVLVAGLEPVTFAVWGFEGATRYLPAVSARVASLMRLELEWRDQTSQHFDTRFVTVRNDTLRRYAVKPDVAAQNSALRLTLLQRPQALPRVFLTVPRCVGSEEEAFAAVRAPTFDGRQASVVQCPERFEAPPADPQASARVTRYEPARVEVVTRSREPALLVLNDAYYRGWSVELDGAPADLVRVNYAVRGVGVPEGEHTVVFRYRAPGLALGLLVTLSTLLVGVAAIVAQWARRPKRAA